jgi:hypothetical protein
MRSNLVFLSLAAILGAARISAQTRFEWPDTTVPVSTYQHAEDCLAVINRVRGDLDRQANLTVWSDTVAGHDVAIRPAPPQVTEAASLCAARFHVREVDVHDFAPLVELYLAAGRDSDAATLVARRLSAVPATHANERATVADSAVQLYVTARPARLAAAEAILVARAHSATDRVQRLITYHGLLQACRNADDTVRAMRVAKWIVDIGDSLTVADRQSEGFEKADGGLGGQLILYDAIEVLTGLQPRLDSLRKSTEALAQLERANWARATGERPEALQLPMGRAAPMVTADQWFPSEAAQTPRPSRGHVGLLLFLSRSNCISYGATDDAAESGFCAGRMAVVRRLATRFPSLEVTIIAMTHGDFAYVLPATSAEEAGDIATWVDAYRIPRVALGVTNTPYWRLDEPDGRRIDKEVPDLARYTFNKSWRVGTGTLFLIDDDGVIVNTGHQDEAELIPFIDVLVRRGHHG